MDNADKLLKGAAATAFRQHKNVLVIFSASWCHPCRTLLTFLNDPTLRPLFDHNFVTLVLYDGERPDDIRHRDTPGARELRDSFHGREAGVPYFAMLDSNGKMIVDSVRPVYGRRNEHGNIGYPGAPSGKAWFMEMLSRAAPSLTSNDREAIENWLTQNSDRE